MTKIMISSLLQLGELGPRLEDYLGQRWLFSSPLSPLSTRPHSGQNYNSYHYLIFLALLLLASLFSTVFPLLAVAIIFSNKNIKIENQIKTQSAKKSQDVILLVLPFIFCVPVSQKLGGKVPFLLKGPFAIFFGGTDILTGLSNKVFLIREKMTVPRHFRSLWT